MEDSVRLFGANHKKERNSTISRCCGCSKMIEKEISIRRVAALLGCFPAQFVLLEVGAY